jgi:hypothetical protein
VPQAGQKRLASGNSAEHEEQRTLQSRNLGGCYFTDAHGFRRHGREGPSTPVGAALGTAQAGSPEVVLTAVVPGLGGSRGMALIWPFRSSVASLASEGSAILP